MRSGGEALPHYTVRTQFVLTRDTFIDWLNDTVTSARPGQLSSSSWASRPRAHAVQVRALDRAPPCPAATDGDS
jgi:hypothetical protein